MYKKNRYFLGHIGWVLTVLRRLNPFSQGTVSILIFHEFSKDEMNSFREQVQWLASRYQFINVDTFHEFLAGRAILHGHNILISFDDGFETSAEAACQVLDPLGIKAIFFLATGFLDQHGRIGWRKYVSENLYEGSLALDEVQSWHAPMSWSKAAELVATGHAVGLHTINHRRLRKITTKVELEKEIVGSRDRVLAILDLEEITDFAYPFGCIESVDERCLEIICRNYDYCYSGLRGWNRRTTNSYALRRDSAGYSLPKLYLRFLIEGGLSGYYRAALRRLGHMITGLTQ